MKRSIVRYIANGFEIINYEPPQLRDLGELHYAATIAEAIYYLDLWLDPPSDYTQPVGSPGPFTPTPRAEAVADPLLNQEAHVGTVTDGGFIVRELPHSSDPSRPQIDEFCPTMDAVHADLDLIFTPPAP